MNQHQIAPLHRSMSQVSVFKTTLSKTKKQIKGKGGEAKTTERSIQDLTAIAVDQNEMILATAAIDGSICLWHFDNGQPDGVCMGHNKEINCMTFLSPYPFLVSADSKGNLCLWFTKPKFQSKKLAVKWTNKVNQVSHIMMYFKHNSICWRLNYNICIYLNIFSMIW